MTLSHVLSLWVEYGWTPSKVENQGATRVYVWLVMHYAGGHPVEDSYTIQDYQRECLDRFVEHASDEWAEINERAQPFAMQDYHGDCQYCRDGYPGIVVDHDCDCAVKYRTRWVHQKSTLERLTSTISRALRWYLVHTEYHKIPAPIRVSGDLGVLGDGYLYHPIEDTEPAAVCYVVPDKPVINGQHYWKVRYSETVEVYGEGLPVTAQELGYTEDPLLELDSIRVSDEMAEYAA